MLKVLKMAAARIGTSNNCPLFSSSTLLGQLCDLEFRIGHETWCLTTSFSLFPFSAASDIPVLKEVEALTEPAVFNMVRFVIAAIPFLPFVIRAFGDRRTRNGGLELGVWVSLAYLAQAIGLITSEAGRASFIAAFTVCLPAQFFCSVVMMELANVVEIPKEIL